MMSVSPINEPPEKIRFVSIFKMSPEIIKNSSSDLVLALITFVPTLNFKGTNLHK